MKKTETRYSSRHKNHYKQNKEKIYLQKHKEWREKNRGKIFRVAQDVNQIEQSVKYKNSQRRYYEKNKDKINEKNAKDTRKKTAALKILTHMIGKEKVDELLRNV